MKRSEILMVFMVGFGVLLSAVLVVKSKHENRRLVTDLAELRLERERIDAEWSQLQLEEATLANPARVEQIARERLSMTQPKETLIVDAGGARK